MMLGGVCSWCNAPQRLASVLEQNARPLLCPVTHGCCGSRVIEAAALKRVVHRLLDPRDRRSGAVGHLFDDNQHEDGSREFTGHDDDECARKTAYNAPRGITLILPHLQQAGKQTSSDDVNLDSCQTNAVSLGRLYPVTQSRSTSLVFELGFGVLRLSQQKGHWLNNQGNALISFRYLLAKQNWQTRQQSSAPPANRKRTIRSAPIMCVCVCVCVCGWWWCDSSLR